MVIVVESCEYSTYVPEKGECKVYSETIGISGAVCFEGCEGARGRRNESQLYPRRSQGKELEGDAISLTFAVVVALSRELNLAIV